MARPCRRTLIRVDLAVTIYQAAETAPNVHPMRPFAAGKVSRG
jgi:hypothetical protein